MFGLRILYEITALTSLHIATTAFSTQLPVSALIESNLPPMTGHIGKMKANVSNSCGS